jgi:hypothetical protein
MPQFKITMSDTVTYARTFSVTKRFKNEAAAEAWAEEHIDDIEAYAAGEITEEQVDNDPWEIQVEELGAAGTTQHGRDVEARRLADAADRMIRWSRKP